MGWVDVARALAIVLVVLYHSALFVGDAGVVTFWNPLYKGLETFRMPLFFFVAGIFAHRLVSGSLRDLIRNRVAMLLWVYVFWSLIWEFAFTALPPLRMMTAGVPLWESVPRSLTWPTAGTWFLYALAAFFLMAWAIRWLPVTVQFILAGGLAVASASGWLVVHNGAFHNIALYFVYFLAAVHAGRWSVRIVGRTRLWHAVALLALFVTLSWADLELGLRAILGFRMVVSVAAIACGLTVAFQLARLPHTTWVRMLGRRTLPIYLLHLYPVLWTAVALDSLGGVGGIAATLIPVVLAAGSILFSLAFWGGTRWVPGLYDVPWRRPTRGPVRHRAPSGRNGSDQREPSGRRRSPGHGQQELRDAPVLDGQVTDQPERLGGSDPRDISVHSQRPAQVRRVDDQLERPRR